MESRRYLNVHPGVMSMIRVAEGALDDLGLLVSDCRRHPAVYRGTLRYISWQ